MHLWILLCWDVWSEYLVLICWLEFHEKEKNLGLGFKQHSNNSGMVIFLSFCTMCLGRIVLSQLIRILTDYDKHWTFSTYWSIKYSDDLILMWKKTQEYPSHFCVNWPSSLVNSKIVCTPKNSFKFVFVIYIRKCLVFILVLYTFILWSRNFSGKKRSQVQHV